MSYLIVIFGYRLCSRWIFFTFFSALCFWWGDLAPLILTVNCICEFLSLCRNCVYSIFLNHSWSPGFCSFYVTKYVYNWTYRETEYWHVPTFVVNGIQTVTPKIMNFMVNQNYFESDCQVSLKLLLSQGSILFGRIIYLSTTLHFAVK